jgi:hypothetical protein
MAITKWTIEGIDVDFGVEIEHKRTYIFIWDFIMLEITTMASEGMSPCSEKLY